LKDFKRTLWSEITESLHGRTERMYKYIIYYVCTFGKKGCSLLAAQN